MPENLDFLGFQNPTQLDKRALALRFAIGAQQYLAEFIIPGHPLITRTEWVFTTAQTNAALIAAVAATRTHLMQLGVFIHASASVNVAARIGFASAALPAESVNGASGIILNHELMAGSGIVLGDGGSPFAQSAINQPLLLTCGAPTGGKIVVVASYFQSDIP